MATRKCEIRHENVTQEGRTLPGVTAVCNECEHEQSCFGTSEASVKRALVMLRNTCPNGEENFYKQDTD